MREADRKTQTQKCAGVSIRAFSPVNWDFPPKLFLPQLDMTGYARKVFVIRKSRSKFFRS